MERPAFILGFRSIKKERCTMLDPMDDLKVDSRIHIQAMSHGEGFHAQGLRGTDAQMDPFLMADHYRMSQPTFGPHPHAGFSAVTYMFDDAQTGFDNRDSLGDQSHIAPGDAHWTVAGKGVVHDEVPSVLGQVAHGLQLFVNLAAKDKHREPAAIHVKREQMPVITQAGGARVKLGFGHYDDGVVRHEPVVHFPTDASLLDVTLGAEARFRYPVAQGINAMLYVVSGSVIAQGEAMSAGQAVHFSREGGMLTVLASEPAHVVVLYGTPLNEPVVRHGPFAMTNQADIARAIEDYQAGRMGHLQEAEY
jgi:redox-sensitive bicupin YhaK (pirin superfamily)